METRKRQVKRPFTSSAQNPPDPAKMERREALKALRTVLRNSVSTQATYDGKSFDETLALFTSRFRTIAEIFSGIVRDAPTHPNAKHFEAFAAMAAKHKFNWHDLALRELNLTPPESANELHRVTRERDALLAEVERLRSAQNVVSAIESLRPLATRAYRTFDNAKYDASEADPDDKPVNYEDPLDRDAMPSVTLLFDLATDESVPWSAHVDVWEELEPEDDDDSEDPAFERVTIAFGPSCATPADAVAELRKVLEGKPDEGGMFIPAQFRDWIDSKTPSGEKPN